MITFFGEFILSLRNIVKSRFLLYIFKIKLEQFLLKSKYKFKSLITKKM